MVQYIKRNPSTQERFGQAFVNAGQAAGEGIAEHYKGKEEDAAIKRITGKDLSGLPPDIKRTFIEKLASNPNFEKTKQVLIDNGVSEEDADLYTILTVGGQTAFVKDLIEKKKRNNGLQNQFSQDNNQYFDLDDDENGQFQEYSEQEPENILNSQELPKKPSNKISPEKQVMIDLKNHLEIQDQGLTPAEKVARGKERFDHGIKKYEEAGTKLRGLTRDTHRMGVLEDLAKSKKLPKNLGRVNVDGDGNLRAPFLASPEAQRFIKTLNEFSEGAKDTFGSRVTNFDLAQHFRKFPGLLNSEEGIRQVLQQMRLVNQINSVYYKNLKNVYDQAGGVRNIDADVAERYAEKLSEPKIEELSRKFKEIGQFTSLPSASEFKGRKIKDTKTGEILISDGENWRPE